MMTTSASSSSSMRSLRSRAVPDHVRERRRELVELALPVRDDAGRRDDERLELLLAVGLRVLLDGGLHREQERDRLDRLAEAHVVGEDAARADLVEEREPLEALLLVRAELRLEVARLLDDLDLVDVLELLEEILRVGGDVRLADLLEQLLDAARPATSGSRLALPAAGREDLGLAEQHRLHLLGVELRERAVLEAHVAAALGEAARELVLRDGDALGLEREAEREPVDAARDARVRLRASSCAPGRRRDRRG